MNVQNNPTEADEMAGEGVEVPEIDLDVMGYSLQVMHKAGSPPNSAGQPVNFPIIVGRRAEAMAGAMYTSPVHKIVKNPNGTFTITTVSGSIYEYNPESQENRSMKKPANKIDDIPAQPQPLNCVRTYMPEDDYHKPCKENMVDLSEGCRVGEDIAFGGEQIQVAEIREVDDAYIIQGVDGRYYSIYKNN